MLTPRHLLKHASPTLALEDQLAWSSASQLLCTLGSVGRSASTYCYLRWSCIQVGIFLNISYLKTVALKDQLARSTASQLLSTGAVLADAICANTSSALPYLPANTISHQLTLHNTLEARCLWRRREQKWHEGSRWHGHNESSVEEHYRVCNSKQQTWKKKKIQIVMRRLPMTQWVLCWGVLSVISMFPFVKAGNLGCF